MNRLPVVWAVCVLGALMLLALLVRDAGLIERQQRTDDLRGLVRSDFTLTDAQGQIRRTADFKGKFLLVYFGFTRCPAVCPTTLLTVANAVADLGVKADRIQTIFITLDPERDTPALVAEYVSHFGGDILGLSGTPPQIKDAADHYKVYYAKVADPNPELGYVIDHSSFLYLIGPKGEFVTHFPHNIAQSLLTEKLNVEIP